MDITERVAKMRLVFHANAVSFNNVLNQIHVITDETAEERNKNHVMTILTDILPRLGKNVDGFFKSKES